jgi:hypothetical protein
MGRPRDPVLKAAAVEITQTLINWALGIVATLGGGAIGWLARSFASLRDADSKLTDKVHDLAVLVAGMQQAPQGNARSTAVHHLAARQAADRGARTVNEIHGALAAAAALFNAFTWTQLIPSISSVGFAVFIILAARAVHRDASNKFDLTEFFRDEVTGKLSLKLAAVAVCCTTHTWYLWSRTISDKVTLYDVLIYAGVWSSSQAVLKALDIYRDIKMK